MISAMGPDTNVMAFSLHGVGANQSRHEILPDMLSLILADKAPVAMKTANGRAYLNLERPIFDPMATVVVVEFEGSRVQR